MTSVFPFEMLGVLRMIVEFPVFSVLGSGGRNSWEVRRQVV